ncbi:glycosyltransferase [Streptomyces sp. NPDC006134]|uniref:glycosyltransferase n=1 Tax=Streptomyces sp. NPDC006134 TaxID=3154467 RepID=UPI003407F623
MGPELPDVLALASVVVARSGAGTVSEPTALGKPSVLVPLASSAGNDQEHNALHLERAGAAVALTGTARRPVRSGPLWGPYCPARSSGRRWHRRHARWVSRTPCLGRSNCC